MTTRKLFVAALLAASGLAAQGVLAPRLAAAQAVLKEGSRAQYVAAGG